MLNKNRTNYKMKSTEFFGTEGSKAKKKCPKREVECEYKKPEEIINTYRKHV